MLSSHSASDASGDGNVNGRSDSKNVTRTLEADRVAAESLQKYVNNETWNCFVNKIEWHKGTTADAIPFLRNTFEWMVFDQIRESYMCPGGGHGNAESREKNSCRDLAAADDNSGGGTDRSLSPSTRPHSIFRLTSSRTFSSGAKSHSPSHDGYKILHLKSNLTKENTSDYQLAEATTRRRRMKLTINRKHLDRHTAADASPVVRLLQQRKE